MRVQNVPERTRRTMYVNTRHGATTLSGMQIRHAQLKILDLSPSSHPCTCNSKVTQLDKCSIYSLSDVADIVSARSRTHFCHAVALLLRAPWLLLQRYS